MVFCKHKTRVLHANLSRSLNIEQEARRKAKEKERDMESSKINRKFFLVKICKF